MFISKNELLNDGESVAPINELEKFVSQMKTAGATHFSLSIESREGEYKIILKLGELL